MRSLLLALLVLLLAASCSDEPPRETGGGQPQGAETGQAADAGIPAGLIIDSAMPEREAIGIPGITLPPDCPRDVLARLVVVPVKHHGLDGRMHQGQIVVDRDLAGDVALVFALMLDMGFRLHSVLPIAHPDIQAKAPYGLTPDTNNSSGFAYRPQAGGDKLSMHARGLAVDLNPRENPYIKGQTVLPPRSAYAPGAPGTLTPDHPVVLKFKELGWEWGGDWTSLKDYMHFQKVPTGMDET